MMLVTKPNQSLTTVLSQHKTLLLFSAICLRKSNHRLFVKDASVSVITMLLTLIMLLVIIML